MNQIPILPPIARTSDKSFLSAVQSYIKDEKEKMEMAGQCNAEQQCVIYGQALDKVIDYCTNYKGILTAIKQEYDQFIDVIKQSQIDVVLLQGKLKALASEPTTLMYHRKRATELSKKIEIIHNDSCRIESELKKLQDNRRLKSEEAEDTTVLKTRLKPSSIFPGMTVEDSLSKDKLTEYLQELIMKRDTLKADIKSKYVPVHRKKELESKLSSALQEREEAEILNKKLMASYKRRRLIADTISTWAKSNKDVCLYDTILQVTANGNELNDDTCTAGLFDELEPSKISEGESVLDYVERFNELFVSKQFQAAAAQAANSPKGILRNMETMEKFKAAPVHDEDESPLLLFFEALMGSSHLNKHPVNAAMALDGIQYALSHDKLELVVHWVTQQKIMYSEAMGDFIYDYGQRKPYYKSTCLALAQLIYRKCPNYKKAALCMCLQGQVQGALDYTSQCKHFTIEDYVFLLRNCPNAELIYGLTKERNGKPAALSVGQAVLSLISIDHKEFGFQLLETIHNCGEHSLEQVILNDVACTPEGWVEIADECLNNNYQLLSEKVMSIVISQDGIVEITSNEEDGKIMEHVFM